MLDSSRRPDDYIIIAAVTLLRVLSDGAVRDPAALEAFERFAASIVSAPTT
jgi:hypothetical protein